MRGAADDARRARTWVDHLRAGGTTPWPEWRGEPAATGAATDPATDMGVPGAQQLELLRRTNLRGHPSPALARAVLEAGATGRGMPDRALLGTDPVGPGDLPEEELVRVAVGVLADLLLDRPARRPGEPRARPWRVRYRLVGDPTLADAWRAYLRARGRPPGGRHPLVLVVGTDLETMLAHVHRTRVAEQGIASWPVWLDRLRAADELPPRVDLARVARTWEERVGPERVRVVLDTSRLPRLLGVRRLPSPPAGVDATGTELARRVARVLGVMVQPEQRRRLVEEQLWPQLTGLAPGRVRVPDPHRAWLAAQAERVRADLRSGGVPVLGDPDLLLPGPQGPDGSREPRDLLDVATRLLLRLDPAGGGA